jgi:hypothetical protein
MFTLNWVPHVEYARSLSIDLAVSTTVTLLGYRFGNSSAEITGLTYGPRGHETNCASWQWISSTELRCTLTGTVIDQRIYFLVATVCRSHSPARS